MNTTEITSLITAAGILIGIIVNAILTLRNGWKTDIVAAHVNSAATKAQEEIRSLRAEVESMRVDASDKKEIASLLASKVPSAAAMTVEPQKVEIVNEPHDPVPTEVIKPSR